jgi:transcriptional regulator with GAF, ATPase, and Fis domain
MNDESLSRRVEDRRATSVLIVSPSARLKADLRGKLLSGRWLISEASSGAEAIECLHESEVEVLLLHPTLPDLEATEFTGIVREQFPKVQIITVNPQTGMLVLGTSSPTSIATQLTEAVYHARDRRPAETGAGADEETPRPAFRGKLGLRGIIGESAPMQRVYKMAHLVAPRDTTVLITGESGTGKDLMAQAIHLLSARAKQPFVVINCAAIPEPLLEAELFGYVKGSFTGAVQSRIGRIHAAHGGTLFLDEIGEMPLALQSKILRFLEQGEVQRIGGNDNLKVDVRVVAATNADLKTQVEQKLFREDLYYRLAVFPISLPPLRERFGDITPLAKAFLQKFLPGAVLSDDAAEELERHHWPGNVRELRNVVERSSIFAGEERELRPEHILI